MKLDDTNGDIIDDGELPDDLASDDVDGQDGGDDDQDPGVNDSGPEEVFAFDGDEPTGDDAPNDTDLVKRLRGELRERDRRLAALEKPAKDEGPGPRPTLEDCGWDEEAHAEALLAWADKRNASQRKADEAKAAQEAQQRAWQDRVTGFQTKAQTIKMPDGQSFEGAVQSVLDHFTPGVGMDALKAAIVYADDPRLVLAINGSPSTVAMLKGLGNDALAIGVAIGELKGKIKSVKRDAPTPEKIVRGGTPAPAGSADKTLARLEAEADKTGDRSKVIAYRREQRRQREAAE